MVIKLIDNSWIDFFSIEFGKKYFQYIENMLERYKDKLCPKNDDIFRIFELLDLSNIKVIIIGQDPYHNLGEANGIAFGVNKNVKIPPSLKNIDKEIYREYNKHLIDYSLINWVKQGVLLINSIWTVFPNQPLSCKDWGWEEFTKNLIRCIYEKNKKVIYLCFGNWASKFIDDLQLSEIIMLKTSHPSPFSANKGFLGSNIFKKTNEILNNLNLKTIDWC